MKGLLEMQNSTRMDVLYYTQRGHLWCIISSLKLCIISSLKWFVIKLLLSMLRVQGKGSIGFQV